MSAPVKDPLAALRRKLERWELLHLREHVEELRQQLDQALAELDATKRELVQVESWGEMWHRTAEARFDVDGDLQGCAIGLTQDGQIVPLQATAQGAMQ